MMVKRPREFATALRDLVERSQRQPATAVSDQAYQMKLRILDHFIQRDFEAEAFERALLDRIEDPDAEKQLSKGICCQILNTWRSGSYHYSSDGKLLVRALYPADPPPAEDDDGR